MVNRRGKDIELRKRKLTEKEKKRKAREKKVKNIRKAWENFRLDVSMLLLIGLNIICFISFCFHQFGSKETDDSIIPVREQVVTPAPRKKILKVEVLNGCGKAGVAKKLTEYLRQKNIDVVEYGNFERWDLSETLVIDRRSQDLRNAKIIGKIIGVEDRMFPQISPQRQLDVTIIIGQNYKQLRAFK